MDRAEYYFRFDDKARPETRLRVTAFDADGDPLTYNVDGGEIADFDVDASTGEFYFRNPSVKQRRRRRDYEFQVYADDGLHRSDPSRVRVHVERMPGGRPEVPFRVRRDVRPLRQVEVPENMIGDVLDIGSGRHHEFYAFKEPAPRQLDPRSFIIQQTSLRNRK